MAHVPAESMIVLSLILVLLLQLIVIQPQCKVEVAQVRSRRERMR